MAIEIAARDDPERAGRDAIRAAVADIALNVDVRELVIDDGACWTRVLARGGDAVLADVAHHQPPTGAAAVHQLVDGQLVARRRGAEQLVKGQLMACRHGVGRIMARGPSIRGELLDELHMPPGGAGELGGVVIAVAGPFEAVRRELIPLFAGDLAGLAADADRGVGVETGGYLGLDMTAPERPCETIDDGGQGSLGRVAGLWHIQQLEFSNAHE